MKYDLPRAILLTLSLFIQPLYAAVEDWTLDPQHSYVLWKIGHLGFSTQTGKWYVNGHVLYNEDNPQQSKVEVSIPLSKIITGQTDLDKHLKGPLFFNVAKFPTATFVSSSIDLTGKSSAKINGILTLHGVSKPVTLNVRLNKSGNNPVSNQMTMGFDAVTTVNRSDFGLSTLLPDLGDEVTVEIGAEMFQSSKALKSAT